MMTAVLAPLGGRLVDKQGARAVVLLGMGLLGTGCVLVAITSHPLAFLLAFGGVAATGFGLVAIHVVSAAVEQEFDTNQGLATGIATSGSTAGQLLIVPAVALLLSAYDWRWGVRVTRACDFRLDVLHQPVVPGWLAPEHDGECLRRQRGEFR